MLFRPSDRIFKFSVIDKRNGIRMKNVINIINLVYLNLYHRISLYHVVVTAKIYLKKKSILYLLKPFKFAIFSMQFVDKHSFLKK